MTVSVQRRRMGGTRLLLATLALFLAGCASNDAPPGPSSITTPTPDGSFAPEGDLPSETLIPIAYDGTYPNAAYVCHATVSCRGVETGEYQNDVKIQTAAGNITSIHLKMTWTAPAPNMENLGIAAMAMFPRDCADCPKSVEFAIAKGRSPLALDATGLNVPLDPRGVLHVYFFPLNTANEPIAIEADAETRVRVEGTATLQK